MNPEHPRASMAGLQEWMKRLARALDVADATAEVFVAVVDFEGHRRAPASDIDSHFRTVRDTVSQWFVYLQPGDVLTWYLSSGVAICFSRPTAAEAVDLVHRLRSLTVDYLPFRAGIAVWNGFESSGMLLARAEFELLQAKEQNVDGAQLGPWLRSRMGQTGE